MTVDLISCFVVNNRVNSE